MASWTSQPTYESPKKWGTIQNSLYPVARMSDKLRDNTQAKPTFWHPDLVLLG